ncbi:putative DD41D transposase [Trichonephila clavipes]|nr:putative DD41D transposase [Trichonephila clavipes]
MITNFFFPELNNHDVQELWFQQDGATCHTARATIDLLKDTFGDRLISRFGPVNWPPRSCDLTPLDYFLFVVDHTIEDSPVCDAAPRVAEVMVSELRVHATANVVEPFVQTLVLQTTPILDPELVTWLHDPLRSCG